MSPWLAALFALFIWWFSTGAILMAVRHADRKGPRASQMASVWALPLLAVGIVGFWMSFAWGTIAYHEILLVSVLITMVLYGQGSENMFGIWTFAILFAARISAKLNLFLGVPKINTEFLPSVLSHLPSHFRHARLNWLFPISITGLTFATACWLERLYAYDTAHHIIGFTLLTAITALALLEHWLMVLPLPDEKLWRWMLPDAANNNTTSTRREDAHGL